MFRQTTKSKMICYVHLKPMVVKPWTAYGTAPGRAKVCLDCVNRDRLQAQVWMERYRRSLLFKARPLAE